MQKYKLECYRILFEHFHGAIGGRKDLLSTKAKAQIEMDGILNRMNPEDALKYSKAKKKINAVNVQLQKLDKQVIEEEKTLFDT